MMKQKFIQFHVNDRIFVVEQANLNNLQHQTPFKLRRKTFNGIGDCVPKLLLENKTHIGVHLARRHYINDALKPRKTNRTSHAKHAIDAPFWTKQNNTTQYGIKLHEKLKYKQQNNTAQYGFKTHKRLQCYNADGQQNNTAQYGFNHGTDYNAYYNDNDNKPSNNGNCQITIKVDYGLVSYNLRY